MVGAWGRGVGCRLSLSTPEFYTWFSNAGSSDTERYLPLLWNWMDFPWRSSCWPWLIVSVEQVPHPRPVLETLL